MEKYVFTSLGIIFLGIGMMYFLGLSLINGSINIPSLIIMAIGGIFLFISSRCKN